MTTQRIAADIAEASDNSPERVSHGAYTMKPDRGFGREQLIRVLEEGLNVPTGLNDDRRIWINFNFKHEPSHHFNDEMGDETILPEGYFITCKTNVETPITGLKAKLTRFAKASETQHGGVSYSQRESEMSPLDVQKAFKYVMSDLGIKDPYAIRLINAPDKKGIWISSMAIDEMIRDRYVLNQGEDHFSAKSLSGENIKGEELMQLLRQGAKSHEGTNAGAVQLDRLKPQLDGETTVRYQNSWGMPKSGREYIAEHIGLIGILSTIREAFTDVNRESEQGKSR